MSIIAIFKLLHEILDNATSQAPHKTAIKTTAGEVDYRNLSNLSHRLARFLLSEGVERSDRVLAILPNSIAAVVTLFAASRVGAIFTVLSDQTTSYQIRHVIADCHPRVVVTTCSILQELEIDINCIVVTITELGELEMTDGSDQRSLAFPATISKDPVLMIYTSGSTGPPKGVLATHANALFATSTVSKRLGLIRTDTIGSLLPMEYSYGLYQIPLAIMSGATIALASPLLAGPGLLRLLEEWNVTVLPSVPDLSSLVVRLAKHRKRTISGLRIITNAGDKLSHTSVAELRNVFPDCEILLMYGLTECKRVSVLSLAEYDVKTNSVGRPLDDTECFVVDEQHNHLPSGSIGELVVRGPHVMSGYWGKPEMSDRSFRRFGFGTERVLYTGDLASFDEDGYLYLHGRLDDTYKRHGIKVSPYEVELAAIDIPEITEASLLPPFDSFGPSLFVVASLSKYQIIKSLRKRLQSYQMPDSISVICALPRNSRGKVDKEVLRDLIQETS